MATVRGQVKWFDDQKVTVLSLRKAAKMFSYIFARLPHQAFHRLEMAKK